MIGMMIAMIPFMIGGIDIMGIGIVILCTASRIIVSSPMSARRIRGALNWLGDIANSVS